jgi:hypothetical protein
MLTTWHPLSANVDTNFSDKLRLLGQYNSLADSDHGVWYGVVMCSLVIELRMMDKVPKHKDSESYTPSSKPITFYSFLC